MLKKTKDFVSSVRLKLLLAVIPALSVLLAVPAFASSSVADGTIDPALFDPMVTAVTGNIGAVLPKVLIIVGLLVGIGVVIALVKRNAKPN